MAIVQNPVIGRAYGSVGGIVFSKIFGKNTMRSKPLGVKYSKSDTQAIQRNKFTVAVELGRSILGTVRYGFQQMAVGKSAFNAFISYTTKNATTVTELEAAIDYTKVVVADGTLEGVIGLTATAVTLNKVDLAWTDNSGQGNALATDISAYVLLNTTKKEELTNNIGAVRDAETQSIEVPEEWIGDDVEVYLFFGTVKGDSVCNSEYAGKVVVIT
jgi:hypothetical protein